MESRQVTIDFGESKEHDILDQHFQKKDSKTICILMAICGIELCLVVFITFKWLYYMVTMKSIDIEWLILIYLTCCGAFDSMMIYCYHHSLLPALNLKNSLYIILLLISYASNILYASNQQELLISTFIQDFLYFLCRYLLYVNVNIRKYKPHKMFNIHIATFGIFISIRFLECISNPFIFLITIFTVDIMILYLIINQLCFKNGNNSDSIKTTSMSIQNNKENIENINTNNINNNNNHKQLRQRIAMKYSINQNEDDEELVPLIKTIQQPTVILNQKHIKLPQNKPKIPSKGHDTNNNNRRIKSGRSAVKSIKVIGEYKGNDNMKNLKKLYKKQHKMKQKPPKPMDIQNYMNKETNILFKEINDCFNKNTHYIGLVDGICGIEIRFISNNINGNINGKRIVDFNRMKETSGSMLIFRDLIWNKQISKYIPCVKFEWIDQYNNIETKLSFDSFTNKYDIDNMYFVGKIINSKFNKYNCGEFKMVCVSMKRRDLLKRNLLFKYHSVNMDELQTVPEYVKCMNVAAQKIQQMHDKKQ